uniref:Uncharacterized protein n=2 Tax=Cacopsylla melanoneura TaxID=428564 RepID=A0A8D9DQI8_9HEMI
MFNAVPRVLKMFCNKGLTAVPITITPRSHLTIFLFSFQIIFMFPSTKIRVAPHEKRNVPKGKTLLVGTGCKCVIQTVLVLGTLNERWTDIISLYSSPRAKTMFVLF